jgi:3',5'-cyclic AMP phosphodiesterase CpdA
MRLIAHISDLHFGRHDMALVEALLAGLGQAHPDLIAVSGDLTQRARRREFAAARAFFDRLRPTPMIIVPGNHDVPLYNVVRRFARPLSRFDRLLGPSYRPFFRDDEIAVLGVNTARSLTFKNGRVSFAQMAEISRVFAAEPASILKVLVIHHPLSPTTDSPGLDRVGRWRPALAAIKKAGVHLILSGHHHHGFSGELAIPATLPDTEEGAVLVVHAGTAVSTRTRGEEPNSYNLIRSEGSRRIAVAVQTWDGRRFMEASRRTFELVGGSWRTAAPDAPDVRALGDPQPLPHA